MSAPQAAYCLCFNCLCGGPRKERERKLDENKRDTVVPRSQSSRRLLNTPLTPYIPLSSRETSPTRGSGRNVSGIISRTVEPV